MKPINCRDKTFLQIRQELQGRCAEVYLAWICHGPCTTRQLAELSNIDILNVRPRTTDLFAIGLVELVNNAGHEGVYRARSQNEWEAWQAAATEERVSGQQQLI